MMKEVDERVRRNNGSPCLEGSVTSLPGPISRSWMRECYMDLP